MDWKFIFKLSEIKAILALIVKNKLEIGEKKLSQLIHANVFTLKVLGCLLRRARSVDIRSFK